MNREDIVTFGEIQVGNKFEFVSRTPHDGMSAHAAPFERVGIYRYRSSRGEFMVSNLGVEVREVSHE